MAKHRIEKPARTARCKNPECGVEFKTKRYGHKVANREHCSTRCQQRHWFLRQLAKKRTEAVTCCPNCGTEYPVRIVPA